MICKQGFIVDVLSTDGIDLKTMERGGIQFQLWDFAGQHLYRYTHQIFITDDTMYVRQKVKKVIFL